jgi:cytochrome c-type biogenesis protein CcmF
MGLAELGNGLLLASLAAAAAGMITGFYAGFARNRDAWRYARQLALLWSITLITATGIMWYALLSHDFSVKYVAQVGSLSTPVWVTFVSLWSSLEGSILFWGLVLAGYITVTLLYNGERNHETMPFATGVFMVVGTFFGLLLVGPANPFLPSPSPIPTDGPGPNPLLQNHILMVVHPPSLYLGYVGMTIPFGLAVAALLRGQLGASQLGPLRVALLVPWTFLTIGIVLGGWWAYEVLGWGGYWAWDPVENASLLPWLTATAALHAMMLPGRRGSLKGWTLALVVASFLLTLLGTFMTRSGVFNSVHAFSQSDIGPIFLAFIGFCLVGCVILLAARVDKIEGEGAVKTTISRESAFLVNNLLFVAMTFTVLIGTTFPLITEAVKGTKLSVGEPYFNQMAVPIGVAILFLMGVGPALPWGSPDPVEARRRLVLPAGAGLLACGLGLGLGIQEFWPALTLFCAGFALIVTLRELMTPVQSGRSRTRDYWEAFAWAWPRNRRRFGGYIVHLGIIMMLVSIALSRSYQVDLQLEVSKGQSVEFGDYTVQYTGSRVSEESNRTRRIADFTISNGSNSFTLSPALTSYPGMMTPIGTPAVSSRLTHDLYISLMSQDSNKVGIHLFKTPMMIWLWLGALISVVGSCIAGWPASKTKVVPSVLPEAAVPSK